MVNATGTISTSKLSTKMLCCFEIIFNTRSEIAVNVHHRPSTTTFNLKVKHAAQNNSPPHLLIASL